MHDVSAKTTEEGNGPVLFHGASATALRRTAPQVPQGQLRAPCGQVLALFRWEGRGGKNNAHSTYRSTPYCSVVNVPARYRTISSSRSLLVR